MKSLGSQGQPLWSTFWFDAVGKAPEGRERESDSLCHFCVGFGEHHGGYGGHL